ncbi:hypothetical protein [Salinisphaera sp. S4-8]|uniref:hypothetical protein n=1 Tax=Salinisphaera sp. S4-8 TaxID=633357 RepID=UPI003340BF0A
MNANKGREQTGLVGAARGRLFVRRLPAQKTFAFIGVYSRTGVLPNKAAAGYGRDARDARAGDGSSAVLNPQIDAKSAKIDVSA